jgi:hypothetical protein
MKDLSFAGYPVTMELIGDEVYVTCKGVTGTLTQARGFISNSKSGIIHYFGVAKIKRGKEKTVNIDCLNDTMKKFINIYKQAKHLKNGI